MKRRQPPPPPAAVPLSREAGEDACGESTPLSDDEDFDAASEKGPERTCVVTRRKGAPATMIRFVVGPDGAVVPDLRRKLPGRGVWIGAHASLVAEAMRKGAFARGFKAKVAVPGTLTADIEALMAQAALQALAMANKAGAVTTGFAKVEAALQAGKVGALMHATDAADDGIRKLDAAARRAGEEVETIKLFPSRELDLALGRTNVIHAALAAGPAGEAFLTRCRGLSTYRSPAPVDSRADAKAAPA